MESESGPDPEDWRAFRAKLISSGIRVKGEDDTENTEQKPAERTSVAPANEELLKKQDEELWKEYLQGGWAHETSVPEVGGLVCRLPLEARLVRQMRVDPNSSILVQRLYERLCAQLPSDVARNNSSESEFQRLLTAWSSNTMYMYRLAESMKDEYLAVLEEMEESADGTLDLSKEGDDMQECVMEIMTEQVEWQSVALVLAIEKKSVNMQKGTENMEVARCVTLNRPLKFPGTPLGRKLAVHLLYGLQASSPEYDDAFVDRFLEAFDTQSIVYMGGESNQKKPGLLIHGYDLPGSTEIAPGTGIYSGGVKAAVEAVLAKERSPLDFRWFIGEVERFVEVLRHEWSSVACARPLALKQCLQLPKPLWHEVMELCGGDLKSFSQIEIQKRDDLNCS